MSDVKARCLASLAKATSYTSQTRCRECKTYERYVYDKFCVACSSQNHKASRQAAKNNAMEQTA